MTSGMFTSNLTCVDLAKVLIDNFNASAPVHFEVGNRDGVYISEMEIEKDDQGRCILVLRLEEARA